MAALTLWEGETHPVWGLAVCSVCGFGMPCPATLGLIAQERRTGCAEPGCEERHLARGWCSKHYYRRRYAGTLE